MLQYEWMFGMLLSFSLVPPFVNCESYTYFKCSVFLSTHTYRFFRISVFVIKSAKQWIGLDSQEKMKMSRFELIIYVSMSKIRRIPRIHMTQKATDHSIIGIKVKNKLLRRLQKHISDKNFALNQDVSQKDWIAKAIEEKLKREKELGEPDENSLKLVNLSIRIAKDLDQILQARLAKLKTAHSSDPMKSYSKKSWLIEAIEEKLEQDELANKR